MLLAFRQELTVAAVLLYSLLLAVVVTLQKPPVPAILHLLNIRGETRGLVALIILLTSILMKIRLEEKIVREVFGPDYIAYSRQVKRLIPFIY